MRDIRPGPVLFSIAALAIGVLSLYFRDFAAPWQPVSTAFPFRSVLACLSGVFLLCTGVALWTKRAAVMAAFALTAYWALWAVIRVSHEASNIAHAYAWLGIFENLAIMTGALLLYSSLAAGGGAPHMKFLAGSDGQRLGRALFGVSCLVFGVSHFVYADFTLGMIPTWFPDRLGLAYLTGAGHLAAGLAILAGVLPRLAATCEALMMSVFVLFVHVPSIGAAPPPFWAQTYQAQWTLLLGALTLAASAWVVSDVLRNYASGFKKRLVTPSAA
jgi:uncharacterized membrane protein